MNEIVIEPGQPLILKGPGTFTYDKLTLKPGAQIQVTGNVELRVGLLVKEEGEADNE